METRHEDNRVVVGVGNKRAFLCRKSFALFKFNRVGVYNQIFGVFDDNSALADLDNNVVAADLRGVFAFDFKFGVRRVPVNDILSVALRVFDNGVRRIIKNDNVVARAARDDIVRAFDKNNIFARFTINFIRVAENKEKIVVFATIQSAAVVFGVNVIVTVAADDGIVFRAFVK